MPSHPASPHIRKELIDRWVFDLNPKCFVCNELFEMNEEVTHIKGVGGIIRIGEECIEGFVISMEIYAEAFDKLKAAAVDTSIN